MFDELSKLLKELEALTHSQRANRMYQLGLVAREDNTKIRERDAARQLIARLWAGSFYERLLAVMSAYGSRNAGLTFEACLNNSAMLRAQGLSMAPAICDDAQIEKLFSALTEKQQRGLLKRLRRIGRVALVDRLVQSLRDDTKQKYLNVFFFAGEEYVRENLHAVAERVGHNHMARFAYQHPKLAAQFLISHYEHADGPDPRLTWLTNAALSNLTRLAPTEALRVVSQAVLVVPGQRLYFHQLLDIYPNELIAVLAEQKMLTAGMALPRLDKLSDESLDKLLEANVLQSKFQAQMRRTPSAVAEKIYVHTSEGWRDQFGCLSPVFIDRLPEALRIREARRHFANPLIAAKENIRLGFARYIPFAEALSLVSPLIDGLDVELRSLGFAMLIPSIRFHRNERSELLALLAKRRNEADPVRLSIWLQLQALPPSTWSLSDLDSLDALIKSSLAAADLSMRTVGGITDFLFRVLPFHPRWSGERLGKLLRERGIFATRYSLPLSAQQLSTLSDHLKPAVKYWLEREETHFLTALSSLYQYRTADFRELSDALAELAMRAKNSSSAISALVTLKRNAYPVFAELIPQLIKRDKSWATQNLVYQFLHEHRQDLLTPYLGQSNHKGLFHQGNTRLIPAFETGFHRWTEEQQKIYSTQLAHMATESAGGVGNRMFGVRQLVLLPEPPMDVLRKLASTQSENESDLAVRDAVISKIGNLDAGQGVSILVEALNDDRARTAIYALKNLPKTMAADRLMPLLTSVSSKQITVRKEVLRLIGELKTKAAFQFLMEKWDADQHKDVRTAIIRAFWNFAEEERAWLIFAAAAQSSDAGNIEAALRLPTDGLDATGRERLLRLYEKALGAPTSRTRINAITWAQYLPILDRDQVLLPPLTENILSEAAEESTLAANCALTLYAERQPESFAKIVAAVGHNRRALTRILDALAGRLQHNWLRMHDVGREVEAVLARDSRLLARRLQIAGFVFPWSAFGNMVQDLAARGALHADALAAAGATFRTVRQRADGDALSALERNLANADSENLRRLGLYALIALAESTRDGWSRERLDQLMAYRADPADLVAAAAQFTLPASELQPVVSA